MNTISLCKMLRATVAAAAIAAAPAIAATTLHAAEETAPAAAASAPAITVVPAERRSIVETLKVTGTVVPRQEAAVGVDLSGMIVNELDADQGDRVTKGQVLAVLDRSLLDTQLAQAEANRLQAEASRAQTAAQITDAEVAVRQAEDALKRAGALQQKGFAAESQYDNARHAHDSAQAKLISAQKALAAADAQIGVIEAQKRNVLLQIEKTEVKAPADGLVLERDATLGAVVSAGTGALFRIAVGSEFELAADVPETSLPRLETGMPAQVFLAGLDEPVKGTIRLISPEVDRVTRLGTIRITLDENPDIRAGSFARGTIETLRRDGVAVPSSAVIYRGSDAFLQVVGAEGRVSTVPVRLGVRDSRWVQVVQGVSEGQDVVSRAGTFVADGDMVTAVRADDGEGVAAR